jgi:predicted MFS family arabinose efflux permease
LPKPLSSRVPEMLIGSIYKRGLYGPLSVIPVLMASIALALIPFGVRASAVAVLLDLWGLMATVFLTRRSFSWTRPIPCPRQ